MKGQIVSEKETVLVPSFLLVSGERSFRVDSGDYIELYFYRAFDGKDSVRRLISGRFAGIIGDSIGMVDYSVREGVYFQEGKVLKKKQKIRETDHYDDPAKQFALSSVDRVTTINKTLENTAAVFFGGALVGTFVVSPILSFQDGKMDWSQVAKISGASALAAYGAALVSLNFWPRYHALRPSKHYKRVYVVRRLYNQPWLQD